MVWRNLSTRLFFGFYFLKLFVLATSNRLPSLTSLFEPDQHILTSEPNTPLGKASSNPYTVLPFTMGLCILGVWSLGNAYVRFFFFFLDTFAYAEISLSLSPWNNIHRSYHRQADLLLAFVMAVITFWASYPAVVALGKILLQTAPERSRIKPKGIMRGDGRMEAFLRVMREVCSFNYVFFSSPIYHHCNSTFSDYDLN